MTFLARIVPFFPVFLYILLLGEFVFTINVDPLLGITLILFTLYLLPILIFRIHNIFYPIKSEVIDLNIGKYIPWWGSYYFQRIYFDIPVLESILKSFPGLYSFWLRLWGSKIGKNIHWTPKGTITDRFLLEIGNNVVFGYETILTPHFITPINGIQSLLLEKIKIGSDSFIGGYSVIAPGCVIPEKSFLPFESRLKIRTNWVNRDDKANP